MSLLSDGMLHKGKKRIGWSMGRLAAGIALLAALAFLGWTLWRIPH